MWNTLPFEKSMQSALKHDFGQEKGDQYYSQYTQARNSLIKDNFFDEIKGVEKDLTDHGEKHIANVLNNVGKLLGDEIESLNGISLYCLGLIVLFHDVGNINGREKHNKNIAEVYNFVRKKDAKFNRERAIVIRAGEAHCGKSKDDTRDTLKDLPEVDNIDGEQINLRSLAAILRLADELAEGPQRTSQFMIEKHKYDEESQIYHQYASITHVGIDRKGGRISLTYDIDYDTNKLDEEKFKKLLEFTYVRINKLDEERRYNKHYCDLLTPFKRTSVQYNLSIDGAPIDLDSKRIEITDRFPIPGEKESAIDEMIKKYDLPTIDNTWKSIEKITKKDDTK